MTLSGGRAISDSVAHSRERRAWRESPTGEALAFDRWRLTSALRGAAPGDVQIVQPGAMGLFFDLPSPVYFDAKAVDAYGIATMLIEGPLEHRACWWASYDAIEEQVEAALACPQVQHVALKIDSPGGVAAGMGQCHRRLIKLQKQYGKQITAYVDELACSAAYNLAAACKGGIWLAREATVGSVGVILCTVDESARLERDGVAVRYVVTGRRKADLHPGSPVTDEVLQVAQAKVDELGGHFFRAMAHARETTPAAIEDLEAAVFSGVAAVRVGLADGVADWAEFLGTLRAGFGAINDSSGKGGAPASAP